MAKVYAVKQGRKIGVFTTWAECEEQVKGYPGASFKGFTDLKAAHEYAYGIATEITAEPVIKQINSDPYEVPGVLNIHVDGSFDKKTMRYAWALVVHMDGQIIHEDCGYGEDPEAAATWQIAGELSAAMRAAHYARKNGHTRVVIWHDLENTAKWFTGEYRAKNMVTKRYVNFMDAYRNMVEFKWTKGHASDPYNDRADVLAKQALGLKA